MSTEPPLNFNSGRDISLMVYRIGYFFPTFTRSFSHVAGFFLSAVGLEIIRPVSESR